MGWFCKFTIKSKLFYESPDNFLEETLALRLTPLDARTRFLSYLEDCVATSDLNQLFQIFFQQNFCG